MLWGGAQDKLDAFDSAMKQSGLGTMVLGFNEWVQRCFISVTGLIYI